MKEPPQPTEKQIHRAVILQWRRSGLPGTLVATIPNARAFGQDGLTKGLPDLLVLASGLPVGFLELKTLKGRVTPEQVGFKARCDLLGVPCEITRGRDHPIRILQAWGVLP